MAVAQQLHQGTGIGMEIPGRQEMGVAFQRGRVYPAAQLHVGWGEMHLERGRHLFGGPGGQVEISGTVVKGLAVMTVHTIRVQHGLYFPLKGEAPRRPIPGRYRGRRPAESRRRTGKFTRSILRFVASRAG